MRLPVHTAVWSHLGVGAPTALVAAHESVSGSYLPPLLRKGNHPALPPQKIAS
jgi:hypothetical protein